MNSFSVSLGLNTSPKNLEVTLSQASSDILQRLKKVNNGCFFRPDQALVNDLKMANPTELTKILNCYFSHMIQDGGITDPVKFLDRLATLIPLEKIQAAMKEDVADVLKEAKGMFEEAKLYLQMTHGSTSPSIRARISSILEGIIAVIESIITACGLGDFFKPAESDIHADMKSQKIMILLSLFSMITTMILPVIGASSGGLIIGGALLAIAALSVIWPFIKPITTYLPANAENWTKQVQNGGFVAQGRKESVDEIATILKMNRHAILVGPSRVGKSLTAKAFAHAIARGDYPELKGKVVFRINTADIVGHQASSFLGGGNDILNKISRAMGRHRNDIILVMDEIHMACKNDEKIADQLKTFLDEGGEFPHVIAITTEEEYVKHVKDNQAFALRFDRVDINNTSQDETLKILSDTLLRSQSKPLIAEDSLDRIYEKSRGVKNAPQPTTALKLLKRCINRTEKTQRSPTERKIVEVSNKILSLRSQAAASRSRKKDVNEQITDLEKQLSHLQATLSTEQIELNKLFKAKDLLDRVTKETYSCVLKIATITQKTLTSKNEKQLKMFLLLREFLGRAVESYIVAKSKNLGIKALIDEALINEVAGV